MKIVKTRPCPIQEKFLSTRKELSGTLIERDGEVDLVLAALVAKEHVLLVGPPGCGKSLLLDGVMNWMHGKRFSILLTKFTCPEEVVGPVSIAALKEDKYRRVTIGKLPEADLAFLDEVFKASSAILNTLLRLLNERVFEDGDGGLVRVPLKLCVAASNEWPQGQEGGKELAALFDRFVFRRAVRPILSGAGRKRLLWERDHTPRLSTSITPAEVDLAHADAMALPWSEDGREALEAILRDLSREGIHPGDRRQFKAVACAQAYAWLDGAEQVEPEHLEILAHVLWDDPEGQPEKVAQERFRSDNAGTPVLRSRDHGTPAGIVAKIAVSSGRGRGCGRGRGRRWTPALTPMGLKVRAGGVFPVAIVPRHLRTLNGDDFIATVTNAMVGAILARTADVNNRSRR